MTYWIRKFFSSPQTHGRAIGEVLITTTFALLPLLITTVVFNYGKTEEINFTRSLSESTNNGQLFLYSYALFGSIFWLSFMKWDKDMSSPRRLLGFISVIITLLLVSLLGLDPTLSSVKNPTIVTASYWTYGSFLIINYLLLFYIEIEPRGAEESLRAGTDDLKKKYRGLGDSNGK